MPGAGAVHHIKSCREQVQQKSAIERQVLASPDDCHCGTLANACRPRSVMTYNERCSLCGSSVTYCSNTKRASPARDFDELTVRPRAPAARNAFRNQISSLVKWKPTLAALLRKPAATSICAVFQPRHVTDRSACASLRILSSDIGQYVCYRCELGASARHKAANLGVAVTVAIGPHDGRAETVGFGYNCRVGHHKPLPINSDTIMALL